MTSDPAIRGDDTALSAGNVGSTKGTGPVKGLLVTSYLNVLKAPFQPQSAFLLWSASSHLIQVLIERSSGVTDKMAGAANGYTSGKPTGQKYSVLEGAQHATAALTNVARGQLPVEILSHLQDVQLTTATDGTQIYFPCPFKETEATVALKSIEACAVAAIADIRYGKERRRIEINLERTATFLFSTYIATIAGMGKQDPNVKSKLKRKYT